MRTLFLVLIAVGPVHACNVPVFRYALERWPASSYSAVLYHRGVGAEWAPGALNVTVRRVDVRQPMTADDKAALGDHPLPWLQVRYPDDGPTSWAGPAEAFRPESPARTELIEHLARGTAIVWVLLDGDDATEAMLRRELSRLEKTLKLPDVDAADLKTALPLKVSFAVVKITRAGPEADLAREFVGSDDDLRNANGPIVFPIVGRGRMLFGLHGGGLTPAEVASCAAFACGACSCRVKELNPGVDLLLGADWPALLDVTDTIEMDAAPPAPAIPKGTPPPAPAVARPQPIGPWAGVGVVIVSAAVGFWAARRKNPPGPGDRNGVQ